MSVFVASLHFFVSKSLSFACFHWLLMIGSFLNSNFVYRHFMIHFIYTSGCFVYLFLGGDVELLSSFSITCSLEMTRACIIIPLSFYHLKIGLKTTIWSFIAIISWTIYRNVIVTGSRVCEKTIAKDLLDAMLMNISTSIPCMPIIDLPSWMVSNVPLMYTLLVCIYF